MKTTTKIRTIDDKDRRIIALLRTGHTVKEIARIVFLSHQAVDYRVKVMRDHFGCKNRTELISHLITEGLV
jgi:DNA-binding NarL/FixJ family response regulator